MASIPLNKKQIDRVKALADDIAHQVRKFIAGYSTVSIERTLLRLYGVDGVDKQGAPFQTKSLIFSRKKIS